MPDAINPSAIPGDNLRPDMVEIGAREIKSIGEDVSDQGGTLLTTWQRLAQHYEAPEAGTLFGVMDPVKTNAETFGTNVAKVSSALTTYAAEVEPIKAELAKIKAEAQDFVVSIAGGVEKKSFSRAGVHTSTVEWHEDQDTVDANNALIGRVNAQMVLLWAAERKCANAIYDVIGFPHIDAASESNPNGYGVTEIPEGAETPWGKAVERSESCGEKAVGAVKGFVWDGVIVGGLWGTVVGLGSLTLGYNPQTGEWFDSDTYGAAWSNLGMLAVGLASTGLATLPLSQIDNPVGEFMRKGQDTLLNAGKGLIAWDKWQDDPAAAAGESVFNVATLIVPVGAATAPVRVSASTAAAAIRTTAKVVNLMDPAALLGRVSVAGSKVAVPAIADLVKSLDFTKNLDVYDLGRNGAKIELPDFPGGQPTKIEVPSSGVNDITVTTPKAEADVPAPVRSADQAPDVPVREPVREPAVVGSGNSVSNSIGGGSPIGPTTTGGGLPPVGGVVDLDDGVRGGSPDGPGLGPDRQPPGDGTGPGDGQLGQDPTAPYGRDGDGQPLTQSEFDQTYGNPDGQPNYGNDVGGQTDLETKQPDNQPTTEQPASEQPATEQPAPDRGETARPADEPQPVLGQTDGGPGQWVERSRNHGQAEQVFATGIDRSPNGKMVEYLVPRGNGLRPLDFDGFLRRGDPPIDVYQEVKGNYSFFDTFKNAETHWTRELQGMVDQAARQRAAIGPDPELEWIFTHSPERVQQFQDMLDDQGINATVRYVPYVR